MKTKTGMKVFVIDVSGRVLNYDIALCKSLHDVAPGEVRLFLTDAPANAGNVLITHLLRLVPAKYKNSDSIIKRGIKAFEGLLNYAFFTAYCLFKKPDVIHFQWLPFLEICRVERFFLRIIKAALKRTRLVLTIHNVFPHDFSGEKKEKYRNRFLRVSPLFDAFIVHTEITKSVVNREYAISPERIFVIHHGVFEPDLSGIVENKENDRNRLRLIVFGNQNPYKGTDLLIDAMSMLPDEQKSRIELSVLGQIQPAYYEEMRAKEDGITVHWKPFFVDDHAMYQSIVDSDVIALPYREISQSGVLLLSLFFNKPIICSDLPSFKETMKGYPEDLFFKAGDATSLSCILTRLITEGISEDVAPIIAQLRSNYSWHAAAEKTREVYLDFAKK